MSRRVAESEIIDTHSGFRWGFIRGIMMGFIRGFRLEDHPLRPAKTLVMRTIGGSAGIPDSLAHKPVDTSGRTGWSSPPCRPPDHPFYPSYPHSYSPFLFVCFISCCSLTSFPVSRRTIPVRGGRRVAGSLTCGNRRNGYRNCDRTDGFIFVGNSGGEHREKSLENGRLFLLHAARGRVIIELPPGEPETTPNTTPGASYVRRMGPIMCYADTATETDNTVTVFCYCGWVEYGHAPESADAAAEAHQNAPDVIDDTAAVAA